MNNKTVLAIAFLMVGTLLTTTALTTMVPAAFADNKQKAEDESAAAIADCDDNDVEQAGFDCIAIAANDVEIETPEEEELAILSVCKVAGGSLEPEDFDFTVTSNGSFPDQFTANNGDCVDVTIGSGEYKVTEAAAFTNFGTEITGDCVDEDPASVVSRTATGEIQAGQTQTCKFLNFAI